MKHIELPRINNFLFFGVLIFLVMFYARPLLIPLTFAAFFAMLMRPFADKLEKLGVGRVISTILSIFIIILAILLILGVAGAQIMSMSDQGPEIRETFNQMLISLQEWVQNKVGVTPARQIEVVRNQLKGALSSAGEYLTGFVTGITGLITGVVLTLVFSFLFLLNRERYKNFLLKLYNGEDPMHATNIMNKMSHVITYYLIGRLISIVLIFIMYLVGLSIIGVRDAVLLSAIAALLTFIPYVGPVIGGLFPVIMALITGMSLHAVLAVVALLFFVQVIDNYFIEPLFVGGKVSINPFFSIFIIIVGGYIWGVAGTILFLPLLGVVKILCDNTYNLRPYGYLIGGEVKEKKKAKQDSKFGRIIEKIKRKLL